MSARDRLDSRSPNSPESERRDERLPPSPIDENEPSPAPSGRSTAPPTPASPARPPVQRDAFDPVDAGEQMAAARYSEMPPPEFVSKYASNTNPLDTYTISSPPNPLRPANVHTGRHDYPSPTPTAPQRHSFTQHTNPASPIRSPPTPSSSPIRRNSSNSPTYESYRPLYEEAVDRILDLEAQVSEQQRLLDGLRELQSNGIEEASIAAARAGAEATRRGLSSPRDQQKKKKKTKPSSKKTDDMVARARARTGKDGSAAAEIEKHADHAAALQFKLLESREEFHTLERKAAADLAHQRVHFEEKIKELERALTPLPVLQRERDVAVRQANKLRSEVHSLRRDARVDMARESKARADELTRINAKLRAEVAALSDRLTTVISAAKSAYSRMGKWKRKFHVLVRNVRKTGNDRAVQDADIPAVASLMEQIREAHMGEEETSRDLEYVRFVEAVEEDIDLEAFLKEEERREEVERQAELARTSMDPKAIEKPDNGSRLHPMDVFEDQNTRRRHQVENLAFDRLGKLVPRVNDVGGERTGAVLDLAGFDTSKVPGKKSLKPDVDSKLESRDPTKDLPVGKRVVSVMIGLPSAIPPLPRPHRRGGHDSKDDADESDVVPDTERRGSKTIAGMRQLRGGRMYKVDPAKVGQKGAVDGVASDDRGVPLPRRDGLDLVEGTLLDGKYANMIASKANHIGKLEREVLELRDAVARSNREKRDAEARLRAKSEEMAGLLSRLSAHDEYSARGKEDEEDGRASVRSSGGGGGGRSRKESMGMDSAVGLEGADDMDGKKTIWAGAIRPATASAGGRGSGTDGRKKSIGAMAEGEKKTKIAKRVMASVARSAVKRTIDRARTTRLLVGDLQWEMSRAEAWGEKQERKTDGDGRRKRDVDAERNQLDHEVDVFSTVRGRSAAELASMTASLAPHLARLGTDIQSTHPRLAYRRGVMIGREEKKKARPQSAAVSRRRK